MTHLTFFAPCNLPASSCPGCRKEKEKRGVHFSTSIGRIWNVVSYGISNGDYNDRYDKYGDDDSDNDDNIADDITDDDSKLLQ